MVLVVTAERDVSRPDTSVLLAFFFRAEAIAASTSLKCTHAIVQASRTGVVAPMAAPTTIKGIVGHSRPV